MPPTLTFSYSHVDEQLRDQLEIHLASLKRQGLIATWHDRRIMAGSELDQTIDAQFRAAQIILLLVSPDFIASDYCIGREVALAMERHEKGEARVIPVILRHCNWQGLSFGKLRAVPRDGKPIITWTDRDEAFVNVINSLKEALEKIGQAPQSATQTQADQIWTPSVREAAMRGLSGPRSSNLRLKKEFSDYDWDRFRQEGFEFIKRYFQNSLEELAARNPDIQPVFGKEGETRFTAAVYRAGKKVCAGSASIGHGVMSSSAIEYAMTNEPHSRGMNEAVYVKADDQKLYFESLGMRSLGSSKDKLSMEGAAELFWTIFISPIQ